MTFTWHVMALAWWDGENLGDAGYPSIDGKRGIFATLDEFS